MKLAEVKYPAISDDELATLWVRRRVEGMSELAVMLSRCAYTSRRTPHVAFCNGAIKAECEHCASANGRDVLELAQEMVAAIQAYRAKIDGPAGLVWRCEPEVSRENGDLRLYARLCFEPEVIG